MVTKQMGWVVILDLVLRGAQGLLRDVDVFVTVGNSDYSATKFSIYIGGKLLLKSKIVNIWFQKREFHNEGTNYKEAESETQESQIPKRFVECTYQSKIDCIS